MITWWSLIVSFITGITGTVLLYERISGWYNKRITWKRILNGSKDIVTKVNKEAFIPDLIIGGGRAGSILASVVSGNLKNSKTPLCSFDFTYEWNNKNREVKLVNFPHPDLIKNKKILLCLGRVNTGGTLKIMLKAFNNESPAELKTASLFYSNTLTTIPDFYSYKLLKIKKMPWHLNKNYPKPGDPKIS